jgi:ferric-dicitrate binding protein FerR (iron transport regulator)
MTRHLRRTWLVVVTLLALVPCVSRAQRVTVEFRDASLREVIRNFANYSGTTIVAANDVGDPPVSTSIHDLEWRAALDRVLEAHDLVARTRPSGIITIERRTERPRLITVAFFDAPLGQVVDNFATFAGRTIILPADARDLRVTVSLRDVEWWRGLDQVLASAAYVARVDDAGIIRAEKRDPPAR